MMVLEFSFAVFAMVGTIAVLVLQASRYIGNDAPAKWKLVAGSVANTVFFFFTWSIWLSCDGVMKVFATITPFVFLES